MKRRTDRAPIAERFWPKVDKRGPEECWEWQGFRAWNGYGRIGLGGKHGRIEIASRVAWTITNGPIPEGMCVCHHCDNPACVNPEHLFLGTVSGNMLDMYRKGRSNRPVGERHCCARFTEDQVRSIREVYAGGRVTQRELGQRYGVSHKAIGRIVNRKTWAHL